MAKNKAVLTNLTLARAANRFDKEDVYTVDSELKNTMYMWDGQQFGIYFYKAMLHMAPEDAELLAYEILDVLEDLRESEEMGLNFYGVRHSRSRSDGNAEQRENNEVSLLCEREELVHNLRRHQKEISVQGTEGSIHGLLLR